MYKLIISVAISFFLTNIIFAQEIKKGLYISIKGGLTLANQYGKDADSETFLNGSIPANYYANHPGSKCLKTGINLGILLEKRYNNLLSVGFGLNYVQKGADINATQHWNSEIDGYDSVSGSIKWIQNYWTADIPLKLYFPLPQNEFHLIGGPTFGLLSSSEEKGDVEVSGIRTEYTNDRGANDFEIGFLLGLGYNYLLPNKNTISIEFIWNRSFGNSFGGDLVPNSQKYYNQTFNFVVGYAIDLKKKV